ncbi:MAG TPA: protein translocase subunit SecD, partial [Candidatus Paceibacterota bacterium]
MFKLRYWSVVILIAAALLGYFVWHEQATHGRFAFKLGLDLSGGSHIEYTADTSSVPANQVSDSLSALQQVIERRVNAFGVG